MPGAARRRMDRRARGAVGALAVLAALVLAPATRASSAPPAIVWDGAGRAALAHVVADTEPQAVAFDRPVDLVAGRAFTSWQSTGVNEAHAAIAYPGDTTVGTPSLVCARGFPCPDGFPPDYPLDARASHPTAPSETSADGAAVAEAGPESVRAEVEPTARSVRAATGGAVSVGAAVSESTQRLGDRSLSVTAATRVTDVTVADRIRIAFVEAKSTSTARSDGRSSSEVAFQVGPVTTSTGGRVHGGLTVRAAGGDSGRHALAAANASIARSLAGSGVTLRLLGASVEEADGHTRGEVFGVLVSAEVPVSGPAAPHVDRAYRSYQAHVTLAPVATEARSVAARETPLPSVASPLPAPGDVDAGAGEPSPPTDGAVSPAGTSETAAPGLRSPATADGGRLRWTLLGGAAADAVVWFYRALVLLAAAGFVLARRGSAGLGGERR